MILIILLVAEHAAQRLSAALLGAPCSPKTSRVALVTVSSTGVRAPDPIRPIKRLVK